MKTLALPPSLLQVLVTERHAHRPSLVEIVARFGMIENESRL